MSFKLLGKACMWAVPLWLVLAFLTLPHIKKYKLIVDKKLGVVGIDFYHNLDGKPGTEHLYYRDNRNGFASYTLFYSNGKTDDQYNFNGHRLGSKTPYFTDYDHDGRKEIYLLIERNDSIFLTGHQFGDPLPFLEGRFITRHTPINGKIDVGAFFLGSADLDKDEKEEIIVNVQAGFSLQPRALFAYSIAHDSLWRTPLVGAALRRGPIADLDNDGDYEIITGSSAVANYKDTDIPFSDHSAWLFVFDNHLKIKYPPIEFKGSPNHIATDIFTLDNKKYILIAQYQPGFINSDSAILLLDNQGKIYNNSRYPTDGRKLLVKNSSTHYLFDREEGILYQLNHDLSTALVHRFKKNNLMIYSIDLDKQGKEEWLLMNPKENNITVYRHDFSHPAKLSYPTTLAYYPPAGIKRNGDFVGFIANVVDGQLLIQYIKNPYYSLVWPGTLLMLVLIILIAYYVLKYRELKIVARNKELLELQLSSFKSQFDSHFTFNALNAIGSVIYKGRKQEAYDYFTRFSAMVRTSLDNTRKPIIALGEEIDFVKNYLQLQKLRYKEKLSYTFDIDPQVNQNMTIPKMMIQVHVENAIKHGTAPRRYGGKVKISLTKMPGFYRLAIEDNGIGRAAAARLKKDSAGKGLYMMHEFYKVFAGLYNIQITETIEDLYDDNGRPAGTRVIIKIPINHE